VVGGFNLHLRKMMDFVSWDDEIPNIWENKKKPQSNPISFCMFMIVDVILRKNIL